MLVLDPIHELPGVDGSSAGLFLERLGQDVATLVDLLFGEVHGRQEAQHGVVRAIDKQLAFHAGLHDRRAFDRHLSLLASYAITNVADFWGNNQAVVYPSITSFQSPLTGQIYPSWSAFDGFQTTRSLITQLLYTPSTAFTTSIQYRYNHDFPEPIPGLAPVLGALAWQNYGFTPQQLTTDVRFRVTPTLTIDFTDAYFFNFGGIQKWTPGYQVQVLR